MTTQPEAPRLAECLDEPLYATHKQMTDAAAELRRQHEEITQLRHGAAATNLCIVGLVSQRDALLEAMFALRALIRDDALACSYQTLGQYRAALLQTIDRAAMAQQAEPKGGGNLPPPLQAEPVAWIHRQGDFWEFGCHRLTDGEKARGWTEEPLYRAPPHCPNCASQKDDWK